MCVDFTGITHSFTQGKPLLRLKQLVLKPGEITLIHGGNGSGKTTLLRILAGLQQAEIQALSIDGTAINSRKTALLQSITTLMHQQPYMLRTTVQDNLRMVCRWQGWQQGDDRRIDTLLQTCQLKQDADTPATALSVGQQQKLALARAVIRNTPIKLLDEPTASLDKNGIAMVAEVLEQLQQQQKTIVVSAPREVAYLTPDNRIDCN